MKRVFILFMAFVSGIAFLNQISNVARAADFKIGVLYPFSGTLAKFGEENYIGLEFARDIINERGGVLGSKITYVKGDANSTTAAVAEAERLITQDKIKVIMGTYSSTLSAAASEVAERNRVIYWEIIGVGDALTDRGFQYYFRLNSKGSELGTGAVEYLVEEAAPKIKVKAKDFKEIRGACPWDIPRWDEKTEGMAKCTMCIDRIKEGLLPACVKTCPTGTMNFGDRDKMLEMAQQRLKEVKILNPKAELLNYEFVRTIFLVIDDPKKYHKFASADAPVLASTLVG